MSGREGVGRGTGPDVHPVISGLSELSVIGRGGFSVVYRARQPRFDRDVAVKVLTVDIRDGRSRHEFEQECRLAGRLGGHPNIVTVFGSGFTSEGSAYIVMDLFPSGSLNDRLQRGGPLPVAEALRVGVRIAGALETAHRSDVLHRDLKPRNILMSPYGEPALADFGVAAFASGVDQGMTSLALTPLHAPPEVLEGGLPTVAGDVYSLASTLYELLAGRPAYAASSGENDVLGVLLRMRSGQLAPLRRGDVSALLVDALRSAMSLRPGDRFRTAAAFGAALQEVQRELGEGPTELLLPSLDDAPVAEPPAAAPGAAVTVDAPRGPGGLPDPAAVLGPSAGGVAPPASPASPASGTSSASGASSASEPARPEMVEPALAGSATVAVPPRNPEETPPASPDEGGGSWLTGGRAALLAAVVVVVVVAAVVGVTALTGSSKGSGRAGRGAKGPTSTTSSRPSSTTVGGTPRPLAPEQVSVASAAGHPGAFTVSWHDTNGGKVAYVVAYNVAPDGKPVLAHTANGVGLYTSGSALVVGLKPGVTYCFKVGAVLPSDGSALEPTWSTAVCRAAS